MDKHEEKKDSGDISESDNNEEENINPCRCCEGTECRLSSNEWTDD